MRGRFLRRVIEYDFDWKLMMKPRAENCWPKENITKDPLYCCALAGTLLVLCRLLGRSLFFRCLVCALIAMLPPTLLQGPLKNHRLLKSRTDQWPVRDNNYLVFFMNSTPASKAFWQDLLFFWSAVLVVTALVLLRLLFLLAALGVSLTRLLTDRGLKKPRKLMSRTDQWPMRDNNFPRFF